MKKKEEVESIISSSSTTTISIKSEIDSRILLYPLMRCLKPLGSILVITSNKQVARLIDSEYEGDFRNYHILVDLEGATDELLEESGIHIEDYTYVVYDNVGVVTQDKLFIPIGPVVSEEFETEMMYLGEDKHTHILRFGKAIRTKERKVKDKEAPKLTREEMKAKREQEKLDKAKPVKTEEELMADAKAKFKPKKENVGAKLKKLPNLKFPSLEDIELFESNKQFFIIDRNFVKFFFTVFQDKIGISEPNYVREVTRKDARSSSFSQRPASGENSIKLNAN